MKTKEQTKSTNLETNCTEIRQSADESAPQRQLGQDAAVLPLLQANCAPVAPLTPTQVDEVNISPQPTEANRVVIDTIALLDNSELEIKKIVRELITLDVLAPEETARSRRFKGLLFINGIEIFQELRNSDEKFGNDFLKEVKAQSKSLWHLGQIIGLQDGYWTDYKPVPPPEKLDCWVYSPLPPAKRN